MHRCHGVCSVYSGQVVGKRQSVKSSGGGIFYSGFRYIALFYKLFGLTFLHNLDANRWDRIEVKRRGWFTYTTLTIWLFSICKYLKNQESEKIGGRGIESGLHEGRNI